MQLVQPLKLFSITIFRTRSIGSIGMRWAIADVCTVTMGDACPLLRRSIYILDYSKVQSFQILLQ